MPNDLCYNYGMHISAFTRKNLGVPQRRISVYEILLYAVIPFLLIMCGAMPITALFILPVVLVLLFLLYRRFGPYFPIMCIVFYGVLSLSFNYDILSVIYFVTLFFGFCGMIVAMQVKPYLLCATVAVCIAVVGAFVGVGIVRGAEGKPIGDIAASYVMHEMHDPVISYLASDYYDGQKPTANKPKLKPSDEGYEQAAAESLAEWASDEFSVYIWYRCLHYGAVLALVGFFAATAITGRTKSPFDGDADAETVKSGTRSLGGVGGYFPIADMKLPRAYLWTMALPATVTGLVLSLVGGYDALSATVMHLFATIPAAFGCYTLLAYFASLFRGKARIVAYALLIIIGITAATFSIALFILSILGVCDCILNLRFWTKYIRED